MRPFSSCSRRMRLGVSTDTKLEKSHVSITCFTVLFGWSFEVLINFCTILYCSFQGWPLLGRSETLPMPWSFERISEMPLLEILSPLAIARWLKLLAIFIIFHRTFLWKFSRCSRKIGAAAEKCFFFLFFF